MTVYKYIYNMIYDKTEDSYGGGGGENKFGVWLGMGMRGKVGVRVEHA